MRKNKLDYGVFSNREGREPLENLWRHVSFWWQLQTFDFIEFIFISSFYINIQYIHLPNMIWSVRPAVTDFYLEATEQ